MHTKDKNSVAFARIWPLVLVNDRRIPWMEIPHAKCMGGIPPSREQQRMHAYSYNVPVIVVRFQLKLESVRTINKTPEY